MVQMRTWRLLLDLDASPMKASYRKIVDGLASAIQSGRLEPGAALPGTRELAEILDVNRKTVMLAYEDGIVCSRSHLACVAALFRRSASAIGAGRKEWRVHVFRQRRAGSPAAAAGGIASLLPSRDKDSLQIQLGQIRQSGIRRKAAHSPGRHAAHYA